MPLIGGGMDSISRRVLKRDGWLSLGQELIVDLYLAPLHGGAFTAELDVSNDTQAMARLGRADGQGYELMTSTECPFRVHKRAIGVFAPPRPRD